MGILAIPWILQTRTFLSRVDLRVVRQLSGTVWSNNGDVGQAKRCLGESLIADEVHPIGEEKRQQREQDTTHEYCTL